MRLAPEVEAASRVVWQLFITLTWSGQVPRPGKRERALRLYLRTLGGLARVPFDSLVWFAREEPGEKFDRPHFHVLIAGLPSLALSFDFAFVLSQKWTHGFSSGRLWIQGLGALEYSGEDGANIYESKKFRSNQPIMLSESLSRVVDRGTGDHVEREDAGHCDNPEVEIQGEMFVEGTGLDQGQPVVTSLVAERRGYLASVNVSRTFIHENYQADITGAQ